MRKFGIFLFVLVFGAGIGLAQTLPSPLPFIPPKGWVLVQRHSVSIRMAHRDWHGPEHQIFFESTFPYRGLFNLRGGRNLRSIVIHRCGLSGLDEVMVLDSIPQRTVHMISFAKNGQAYTATYSRPSVQPDERSIVQILQNFCPTAAGVLPNVIMPSAWKVVSSGDMQTLGTWRGEPLQLMTLSRSTNFSLAAISITKNRTSTVHGHKILFSMKSKKGTLCGRPAVFTTTFIRGIDGLGSRTDEAATEANGITYALRYTRLNDATDARALASLNTLCATGVH